MSDPTHVLPVPGAPPPGRGLRPGDLTVGWRWTLGAGWLAIAIALMITAGAAEVINRPVWWISGDRAGLVVAVLPFVLPIAVVAMAMSGARYTVHVAVLAAVGTALVGVGDLGRSPSAAIVTLVLAVAGLLLAVAATSGVARRATGSPSAAAPTG